jgi:hypothetical protein
VHHGSEFIKENMKVGLNSEAVRVFSFDRDGLVGLIRGAL